MGVMYVKKGGSSEDVAEGWEKFEKEFKSGGSGGAQPAGSSNEWTWSAEHGRYYRLKADGTYEWS
jgi:hypothetical protein